MIPEGQGVPSSRLMTRVLEWVRAQLRISLGAGLNLTQTSAGTSLALDRPDTIFQAKILSGDNTTGYTFRRQRLKAGVWSDVVGRDDPGKAFQANLQDVATPRLALLRDVGLVKEYRFFTPRPGSLYWTTTCCPEVALPSTLYLHAPDGIHPLAFDPDSPMTFPGSIGAWDVCYETEVTGLQSRTILSSEEIEANGRTRVTIPVIGPVSTALYWSLSCLTEGDTWTLSGITAQEQVFGTDTLPGGDLEVSAVAEGFYLPVPVSCTDLLGYFAEEPFSSGVVSGFARTDTPCVECSPLGIQFGFARSMPTFWYTQGMDPYGSDPGTVVVAFVTDSSTPPTISNNLIVTAVRCAAGVDVAAVGAAVELYDRAGTTLLQSGTTNGSGVETFAITTAGAYRVKVIDADGCIGWQGVMVGICGDDVSITVRLCCGTLCVRAILPGTSTPIVGLYVEVPGREPVLTDSMGLACFAFTGPELAGLPREPGGCRPVIRVMSYGDGYASTCANMPISCSGSATEDLEVLPLDEDDNDEADWVDPVGLCPRNCLLGEYNGYIRARLFAHLTAAIQVGGVWYSILGDATGVPLILYSHGPAFLGTTGDSPLELAPYSLTGPAIEYRASGTSNWDASVVTDPMMGLCGNLFSNWDLTVRNGKALFRHRYGTTPETVIVTLPGDTPVCPADPGTETRIEFFTDFNLCDREEGIIVDTSWTVTGGGGLGHDLRLRLALAL